MSTVLPHIDQRIIEEYVRRQSVSHVATRVGRTSLYVQKILMQNAYEILNPKEFYVVHDDFSDFNTVATTGRWKKDSDGTTGVAQILDFDLAAGSILNIATAIQDNDYHGYSLNAETFVLLAGKPMYFEARVLPPTSTNNINMYFGFSDDDSNVMGNDGAGPPASYDGVLFFSLDDAKTKWNFETSNAGTQNTGTDIADHSDGTTFDKIAFLVDTDDDTTAIVTPYVNDVAYASQNLTISGMAAMHLCFGHKNGGALAKSLAVDYITAVQVR